MPHLTTYSFCFDNSNHTNNIPTTKLRDQLKTLYPQLDSVSQSHSNKYSCLTICGANIDVMNARADILTLQPIEVTLPIHSLYPGLAYRKLARTELHKQLELIANKREIQIVVDYNLIVIRLIGPVNKVESARIDVLLFFDQLMGLHLTTLSCQHYTLNVIGNRRHTNILSIMEEIGCNIYLPSPWTKMAQPSDAPNGVAESESTIHVTGNTIESIQRATLLLKKLLPQKIKSMCNTQSVLNPRKRDWLLLYKKQELTKIMRDNGSFISFPAFGSEKSQIQVYAENNVHVERTLRSLNYLTSHIFQAIIYVNTVQSADTVARLSQDSGAKVIYRTDLNQFEITGSKEQIHSAVQIIRSLPISQEHHTSVTFSIELALDQREFISGKKNGKINKIMKSCDAEIQFQAFNDFNFIITIESQDFFKAKDGLDSLQNELPAEISFFVPEICHRRIIGVAGKNIQRVMKQYGVYVKFSSNEELATFGGYFENEHNVVARTPEKNIHNLQKLKSAVMEFITFQKDRDYISRSLQVPAYAQRNLLYMNGKYLRDKGRLYNSKILWPERNGTDHVLFTGPQSHIEEMQSRIQSLLPQSVDIQVPASVVLENILESPEIEDLQEKIYSKTNIFLILPENLIVTTSTLNVNALNEDESNDQSNDLGLRIEGKSSSIALFSPNDCRIFTFKLQFDSNSKNALPKARQMFDAFMGSRFVPVDDTLHNNAFNGSPSPEDIRHISPSVMHHIDHPESYENGHTKDSNVAELMDQQTHPANNRFFHDPRFSKKPLSANAIHHSKSTRQQQQENPPIQFFSTPKRVFEQPGSKVPSKEEFNVWAESPISHDSQKNLKAFNNNMRYRQRTVSQDFESPSVPQFYFPRPELKPNYSTETRYTTTSNPNDLAFSMGSSFYPLDTASNRQQHQRQDFRSSSADPNNNPFAPIGYSRQRSTSLLPSIGSHRQSMGGSHHQLQHPSPHHDMDLNNLGNSHELKNGPSFNAYPLYGISTSSRAGMGSVAAYDHYMMNSRMYSLEKNNPPSSLSTPIPVAVNGDNSSSMKSMNSRRFDFY